MSFLSSRFNASSEENRDPSTGSYAGVPPPSVFGIIVVGLLAGLVVGLLSGPDFTLQGFFLGFAGGALITAGVYFFLGLKRRTGQRGSPTRPQGENAPAAAE